MSSLIKDYLNIVKAGLKNRDKIIEAIQVSAMIKNAENGGLAKVSEEAVAEIMKRKDICASCPFNSKNAKKAGLPVPHAPYDEFCIHCLCRIGGDDTKEYCLSCNCGLTEWNKENPDKQLPLKWEAFNEKINPDAADSSK